jgi:hypothetical protein
MASSMGRIVNKENSGALGVGVIEVDSDVFSLESKSKTASQE